MRTGLKRRFDWPHVSLTVCLRGFQKLEQPEYLPAAQGCPQSKIEVFDEDGCSLNISFFLPFYLPRTFCDWLGEYSRN